MTNFKKVSAIAILIGTLGISTAFAMDPDSNENHTSVVKPSSPTPANPQTNPEEDKFAALKKELEVAELRKKILETQAENDRLEKEAKARQAQKEKEESEKAKSSSNSSSTEKKDSLDKFAGNVEKQANRFAKHLRRGKF